MAILGATASAAASSLFAVVGVGPPMRPKLAVAAVAAVAAEFVSSDESCASTTWSGSMLIPNVALPPAVEEEE